MRDFDMDDGDDADGFSLAPARHKNKPKKGKIKAAAAEIVRLHASPAQPIPPSALKRLDDAILAYESIASERSRVLETRAAKGAAKETADDTSNQDDIKLSKKARSHFARVEDREKKAVGNVQGAFASVIRAFNECGGGTSRCDTLDKPIVLALAKSLTNGRPLSDIERDNGFAMIVSWRRKNGGDAPFVPAQAAARFEA